MTPISVETAPHAVASKSTNESDEILSEKNIAPITVSASPPRVSAPDSYWPTRTRSLMGVRVVATGSAVPDNIVSNAQLQAERGFDPEWIEQRSGILERRLAPPGMATSHLCIEAGRRALEAARVLPQAVDLLVVGTFTPDYLCPSTANLVQNALGIEAPAFDVSAACSGFVYALATAAQYVATGNSELALVIGGDCNSRIVDPNDQKIAPLFGDGAGAVLLAKGERDQGLVCYQLGSDGSGVTMLDRPSGGTLHPPTAEDLAQGKQYLRMDGRNVFKWAVKAVTHSIDLVLEKTGLTSEEVSLYFLHQANIRIINNAAEHLRLPPERLWNNIHKFGNTSAGSIPIALDEAVRAQRVQHGDTLLFSGFGAGLTWGTCLFRW